MRKISMWWVSLSAILLMVIGSVIMSSATNEAEVGSITTRVLALVIFSVGMVALPISVVTAIVRFARKRREAES